MNRSLSLHPLSLGIGLALGLVCLLSMSQVGVSKDSWGPPKRDIVNVFFSPNNGSAISIPPGGSFTVYTVPNDRWLTITGAFGSAGNADLAHWAEDLTGTVTRKGVAGPGTSETQTLYYSPVSGGGAVGWTFSPGSTVVIANDHPTATALFYSYGLIGYLSRE